MKKLIQILFCLSLMGLFLYAGQDEQQEEPQYYDNAKIVRVRHVEGEAYVKRSYEEGNEEATVNLPLFEKDEVGTTDGRLELYLGRLNYVRLDSDTNVELTRLPLPRKTELSLRIISGGIYLDVENLDMEKGIEIQTPDCGVFLLDAGVYRINVLGDGVTEVLVFEGVAEVAGDGSSRNVRENQKIVMQMGDTLRSPFYFYSSDRDSFDSWNEARNRELGYARYGNSRYLESGYEDYEYELSRSGRWIDVDGFHGWIPYSINSYWRPYYHGRWLWHPYYGRIWTSYDTWGWFTHHYGRWHWHHMHGWYWIPAYHWSPAWVSWYWDDYYWGWCPLSWWNRPVIVINNNWHRGYYFRNGIPIHSNSTVVIRKGDLINPHIHKVALSGNALNSLKSKTIAYRGVHAPTDRGSVRTVRVTNASGRSVLYKQDAIVSVDKYQPVKSISTRGVNDSGEVKYIGKPLGKRTDKYTSIEVNSQRTVTRSGYSSNTVSSGSSVRRTTTDSGSNRITSSKKTGSSSSSSSSTRVRSSTKSDSGTSRSGKSSTRTVKKKKDDAPYYSSSSTPRSGGGFASSSPSTYSSRYSSESQTTNRSAARTYVPRRYESSSSYSSSSGSRSSTPGPRVSRSSPQSYSSPVVLRSRGSSSSGSVSSRSTPRISTRSTSSSSGRSSSRSVSSRSVSSRSASSSHSSSSGSSGSARRKK